MVFATEERLSQLTEKVANVANAVNTGNAARTANATNATNAANARNTRNATCFHIKHGKGKHCLYIVCFISNFKPTNNKEK